MNIPTSSEVGQALERAARCLAVACVAAYAAGFTLGSWVHRTNDALARWYVALLGLTPNAPAAQAEAKKPVKIEAVHIKEPLTVEALLSKTNAELREIAGTKSRKSKKDLVAMILAKQ